MVLASMVANCRFSFGCEATAVTAPRINANRWALVSFVRAQPQTSIDDHATQRTVYLYTAGKCGICHFAVSFDQLLLLVGTNVTAADH